MVDYTRARAPSPNVEDRRGEFTELQHLLMSLGVAPPDETNPDARRREALGLEPGMWLAEDLPPTPDLNPLSIEAGALDLIPKISDPASYKPQGRR